MSTAAPVTCVESSARATYWRATAGSDASSAVTVAPSGIIPSAALGEKGRASAAALAVTTASTTAARSAATHTPSTTNVAARMREGGVTYAVEACMA
ncbi:hypothetical protein [Microbacterium sp. 10M-3C3]|jgi:hypothetical protein|uniref:hypothetical protein n=1 Tax=Microbacterium sp. 10M-3C3 TaxID=2483401 RepID=UPI000F6332EE|nr:hypothetical protein [Microbacterium sp. 10M-3C3]